MITGLAALKSKKKAFDERQEERNRPKANWFKINTNETLTVKFLQELSDEAENYKAEFGTYLGAVEHQAPGPKGYLSRALDTMESEGRDFAVEMYKKTKEKDWRNRENFYINVAVDRGDQKPVVEILSRGLYSTFVDDLVEAYDDSDGAGISGKTFTISRKGSGPATVWKLKESTKVDLDVSGLQPWDLETYAIRKIPYSEQEEYYMRNYQPSDDVVEKKVSPSEESTDEFDW